MKLRTMHLVELGQKDLEELVMKGTLDVPVGEFGSELIRIEVRQPTKKELR
jgi:hypothetical protein